MNVAMSYGFSRSWENESISHFLKKIQITYWSSKSNFASRQNPSDLAKFLVWMNPSRKFIIYFDSQVVHNHCLSFRMSVLLWFILRETMDDVEWHSLLWSIAFLCCWIVNPHLTWLLEVFRIPRNTESILFKLVVL